MLKHLSRAVPGVDTGKVGGPNEVEGRRLERTLSHANSS